MRKERTETGRNGPPVTAPRFTPGPWRNCPTNRGHMIGGGRPGYLAEVRECCEDSERKANAHLISAAPDLYEAVQGFVDLLPRLGILPAEGAPIAKAFDRANAALRRAEGKGGAA